MIPASNNTNSPRSLPAAGEPKVWLCGLGLTLGIAMVLVLLGYVFIKGMEVFTPKPIHLYTVERAENDAERTENDAVVKERFLGELRRFRTSRLPGQEPVEQSNIFVGSREFGGAFRWLSDSEILGKETPRDALRIERMEMGFVLGMPVELRHGDGRTIPHDSPQFREEIDKAIDEVVDRRARIRSLEQGDIGALALRITQAGLQIKGLEANKKLTKKNREKQIAGIRKQVADWEAQSKILIARAAEMRKQQEKHTLVYHIVRHDEPVELSFANIVSIEQPNNLNFAGKVATFCKRLWNFVTDWPRDANTDGGIWPSIFGTFIMTIIMSIFVTPFGVVAAIYLREYASQGLMVRAVRISVNNLAGVPSIVFGVFGVAFFIYTMGGFIDGGPSNPMVDSTFWMYGLLFIFVTFVAVAVTAFNSPKPGRARPTEFMRMLSVTLWCAFVVLAIMLVWKNPFFTGFYREALPTPTYGTGGILWASLTLALMTLPVVIVATEEALSAVPRGVREAALASGASKWQMIQRVALPASAPGILTGVILSMARGAGEVAPLMLVGVIPAASTLVVDSVAPFIHAERKFMHLGFHIYDVGFQSPDSEASRPLVFATTFILILLVILLNLSAILIRNRLRKRLQINAF